MAFHLQFISVVALVHDFPESLPGTLALTISSLGWEERSHLCTQWSNTEETSIQSNGCMPP